MNENYVQGFCDKCAEAGVDSEQLMKVAIDRYSPLMDMTLGAVPGYGGLTLGGLRGDPKGETAEGAIKGLIGSGVGGVAGGVGGLAGGAALASRAKTPVGGILAFLLSMVAGSGAGSAIGTRLATPGRPERHNILIR